jgi:hypothetical protein
MKNKKKWFLEFHILLMSLILAIIFSCVKDEITSPHFKNKYEKDKEWLYRKYFISNNLTKNIFDTVTVYGEYEVLKDSVIYGNKCFIVQGKEYEIFNDTVTVYKKRIAASVYNDSIIIYEFQNLGNGIPFLFKSQRSNVYDTTIFSDVYFPVLFPLFKDKKWVTRDTLNPWDHLAIEMQYAGEEQISIEGKIYNANKLIYKSFQDVVLWINDNDGLLKTYINYGKMEVTSSDGTIESQEVVSMETTEFLGYTLFDIDLIKNKVIQEL